MKTKMMKSILALSFSVLLASCASDGNVDNNSSTLNIAPSITDSHAFDTSPIPRTQVLRYQAASNPSNTLTINLKRTLNRITEYQTTEHNGQATIKGSSIGVGGMAPFTVSKQKFLAGQDDPVSQSSYKVVSISNVAGKLFPLQVGNQLSYSFMAVANHGNRNNHMVQGTAVFKVTGKLNNISYTNNIAPPGEVYIIQYSEAIGQQPMETRAQYYFSANLGWFIQVTEYTHGSPVRTYNMVDAQNSLAFQKK